MTSRVLLIGVKLEAPCGEEACEGRIDRLRLAAHCCVAACVDLVLGRWLSVCAWTWPAQWRSICSNSDHELSSRRQDANFWTSRRKGSLRVALTWASGVSAVYDGWWYGDGSLAGPPCWSGGDDGAGGGVVCVGGDVVRRRHEWQGGRQ